MSESKNQKVPGCKVVLLGESGVGKTSIILRYVSGTYNDGVTSTNGASYTSKNLQIPNTGKNILLDIWDTAGQEKYRSLTKYFYKDAAVAILVYDIRKKDSFLNLKDFWYPQIKENCAKNMVIGLAGNKCDMFEEENVSENEARQFADEIGAVFELTSAKNNTGINELFEDVGNKYLDPNFQQKIKILQEQDSEDGSRKISLNSNDLKKKRDKKKFC
jgi:small GTP-binding protein